MAKQLMRKPVKECDEDLNISFDDINFSEFDKVVAKAEVVVATNEEPEEEETFDLQDPADFSDIEVSVDEFGSDEDVEEEETEEVEEEATPETGEKYEVDESAKGSRKSLSEIYESNKNKKTNALVESLLTDDAVTAICDTLDTQLKSHGISKAQAIATIGAILDRMLKANDEEITAPAFMDGVIGDIVDSDDIKKLVGDAIEQAISGNAKVIEPIEQELPKETEPIAQEPAEPEKSETESK